MRTIPAGRVTTLDVHLEPRVPDDVLEVDALQDVGCGIYNCYYTRQAGKLYVSTSAAGLVFFLGGLERNAAFRPPRWPLRKPPPRPPESKAFPARAFRRMRRKLSRFLPLDGPMPCYGGRQTIDKRIFRLLPFETVTPTGSRSDYPKKFPGTLTSHEEIVSRAARHIQEFISEMEERYRDHQHVVMTGGRDSQLILLAKRQYPANWHVFSAEPNYPLVCEWLERNSISVRSTIRHDSSNEETREDTKQKILASDCRSTPTEIKRFPTLRRLVPQLGGRVIFWGGTAGDALISRNWEYQQHGCAGVVDLHARKAAAWQGNYIQANKNYTGAPHLSPYHTEAFWHEVVLQRPYAEGVDLEDFRPAIGERLFGREVWWLSANPGPPCCWYDREYDLMALYLEAIREKLAAAVPVP